MFDDSKDFQSFLDSRITKLKAFFKTHRQKIIYAIGKLVLLVLKIYIEKVLDRLM